MIEIYCDGACSGNPGPGNYGVVVVEDGKILKMESGALEQKTTNNRQELKGMLEAMRLASTSFRNEGCEIYCDSSYVVNICNEWIYRWAINGWCRGKNGRGEVQNLDLVQQLYKYLTAELVNFRVYKVAGHTGNLYNEIADKLATGREKEINKLLGEASIKN